MTRRLLTLAAAYLAGRFLWNLLGHAAASSAPLATPRVLP